MAAAKGTAKNAVATENTELNATIEADEAKAETKPAKKEPEKKQIIPKNIDPSTYVVVKNGYHGKLFYRSSRTGERFLWHEFGDEQEMELRELKNAKNSNKKFFINNWFMFPDAWVVDYLGVRQYYKNAVRIEDYDSIFLYEPEELKRVVASMTQSQKRSAAYRAAELIRNGEIDSLKAIAALEQALGVELTEK